MVHCTLRPCDTNFSNSNLFSFSYCVTSCNNGVSASSNEDRSGGNVDRLGPMCNNDCPERDVANFLVNSVERLDDCVFNCWRRDWRYGVDVNVLLVLGLLFWG